MANFDDLKLSVEALTGGRNTVLFDDLGMPSIMVVIPKLYSSDIIDGANKTVHPAFVVDNVEKDCIYISKYINIIANGRAYSLPFRDPTCSITHDQAVAACRQKGMGWSLTPFALWSAIALWSKKNATMPHGNNNWGADIDYPHEKAVATTCESTSASSHPGEPCRTATGSGPASWYHDHTMAGIADLNGNVWEWNAGMRLKNGEIQIIPYANCMRANCDLSATGTEWKAILADGSLTDGGAANTLKYDYVNGRATISKSITNRVGDENNGSGSGCEFVNITAASGITCPQIIKELALAPADNSGYEGDYFYLNNTANERIPLRGGGWYLGRRAGVFSCALDYARSGAGSSFGFRSAFVKL